MYNMNEEMHYIWAKIVGYIFKENRNQFYEIGGIMDERANNRMIVNILKRGITKEDIITIKKKTELHEMLKLMSVMYNNTHILKTIRSKITTYEELLVNRFPNIFTGQFREEVMIKEVVGEIRFLTALVLLEYSEIKEFLKVRNRFECLFMKGQFHNAIKVIDIYEKENGLSFWGIDCKICALSYLDAFKADGFCEEIIKNCNDLSVKTYVNVVRYRFLRDVTCSYFRTQLESIIQEYTEKEKESNFKESFKKFLTINVDIARGLDLYDIRYLLMISNYVSSIDRYLILEKILGWLCSEAIYQKNNLSGCVYECASFLKKKIQIPFWANICNLLGENDEVIIKEEKIVINNGLKLFCKGEKADTYNYCIEMLEQYPNSFPLMNLLSKSGECEKKTVPYLELAWFVRRLYLKEGKDSEFVRIVELCDVFERIYSLFSFGNNLGVIIENETRPIMLQGKMSYVNALLSLNFTPSKLAFFMPESKRQIFINDYKAKIGELLFCDWQISTYSEAKKTVLSNYTCDETSHMLNKIKHDNCNEKDFSDETKETEMISHNICKSFLLKRQFELAVANDEVLKAIDIYVKAFFMSQWMVIKIDCNKINEKITRKMKSYLENHLSYCIYADITRFEMSIGENISETVVNSCSKIIKSSGGSAADIIIPENGLERKKVVYFLRNICTYDGLRRVNMGVSLVQELYRERMRIIEKILPYYEKMQAKEDINAIIKEKKEVSAKIEYLDIAKCINKGKFNTSWIVFSDEAKGAIISSYNMYNSAIEKDNLTAYVNAFVIVKKDYVQEINRILSITIRHGILEGELLRFLKKGKINIEINCLSDTNRQSIERFYGKVYGLIEKLLDEYLVCTYKYEMDTKLLLYVDDDLLDKSFKELPKNINGPEDMEEIYSKILNSELQKRLPDWGKKICDFIDIEIRKYLDVLYKNCEGDLKVNVNKVCDLLGEEIDKLKEWFSVTENQEIAYRLVTLGDVLEQEWGCVNVNSKINNEILVTGNVINFLYTIIRELIWNAEKHSGYKEDDVNFKIDININMEGENIVFEVINNIKDSAELKSMDRNIKELEEIIKNVEQYDANEINRKDVHEGKSGYHKIVKLLKRTYSDQYQIDIQNTDKEFKVKLSLLLEALI